MPGIKNLVLSGKPGVGKTTLVKEAVWPYRDRAGGFYTEEMLEDGKRLGFRLRTFSGDQGVLASKTLASPRRLKKYGVDLDVLEGLGVESIRKARAGNGLVVIDEIGAMEMMSATFRTAVLDCLAGPRPVLATIRHGSKPYTDSIRAMDQTQILDLTRENYGTVRDEVRRWIISQLEP